MRERLAESERREYLQLPLFSETASLARIRSDPEASRHDRIGVWPDLFGNAMLNRRWLRGGAHVRTPLDPYPDLGAALNASARLVRRKKPVDFVAARG